MNHKYRKNMLDNSIDGRQSKGRDSFTLSDGQVVDKYDVSECVGCSVTTSNKRLRHYSDPEIVFMSARQFRAEGYASVWHTPKKKISAVEKEDSELNANLWKLIMQNI